MTVKKDSWIKVMHMPLSVFITYFKDEIKLAGMKQNNETIAMTPSAAIPTTLSWPTEKPVFTV